jgi:Protein of unknown function (DUF2442)
MPTKEAATMKPYHEIKDLHFKGDYLVLTIDRVEKRFRVQDISVALERASEEERNTFEVSPSGYGIHWPLLDEDIAVDGLLGIVHTREPHRKTA